METKTFVKYQIILPANNRHRSEILSPFDGNLVYWSERKGKNPLLPLRVTTLLKEQKGKCTHCGLHFREDDVMEVDHIIPKSKGGKNDYKNLQLLHRHCHDVKTATSR
ncbi:HNH endonuclease [Nostoc sp. CHAB 5836]|uniref:HNH endonuclease n=1 Tax=Nostoc sp. CHAB 5836 TaxID=2780404 RepID=UPI001E29D8E0|nr:HNH endonuclease signature motif containing protein [Nostoc sp. CHAB 5836]MCC5617845.1 HNH endonuclease [Nostoc sp. CHAB 5836]